MNIKRFIFAVFGFLFMVACDNITGNSFNYNDELDIIEKTTSFVSKDTSGAHTEYILEADMNFSAFGLDFYVDEQFKMKLAEAEGYIVFDEETYIDLKTGWEIDAKDIKKLE